VNRTRLICAAGLIAGGVVVVAQVPAAIPQPRRGAGASVTGAFEGWYYNDDGSRAFLVGYYNRNSRQELDVPIGPNNRIEPGPSTTLRAGPDMGQPTHFMPGRQWGMFTVPVPRDFKPTDEYVWTLVANGEATSIPFRLKPDYVMSPFSEIAVHNTPPVLRFEQNGKGVQGPLANPASTAVRTTSAGAPLALPLWAADDLKYTSGGGGPVSSSRPPIVVRWSKYRGPGAVTFDKARPEVEKLQAGESAFTGTATTTATFAEPGDYLLHVIINDYSGDGGGGFGCCWTTGLVRVTVK